MDMVPDGCSVRPITTDGQHVFVVVAGQERRSAEWEILLVGNDCGLFVEFEYRRAQVIRELVAETCFGGVGRFHA